MKKQISIIAASILTLTGCGSGSSSDSSSSGSRAFDIAQYSPVSGSDSIIGTWVGVANYTEVEKYSENGFDYIDTETGTRRAVLQIFANGTGGYSTYNCEGELVNVPFSTDTMIMKVLNREVSVLNYSTGSNTHSLTSPTNSESEEETSNWVKVSNEYDSGLGTINTIRDSSSPASDADRNDTHTINSFCQLRYKGSDNDDAYWGEEIDVFTYIAHDEPFEFYASKDIYESENDTVRSTEWRITAYDSDGDSSSISVQTDTSASFNASYEGNTTHYYDGEIRDVTIKANATVAIPN